MVGLKGGHSSSSHRSGLMVDCVHLKRIHWLGIDCFVASGTRHSACCVQFRRDDLRDLQCVSGNTFSGAVTPGSAFKRRRSPELVINLVEHFAVTGEKDGSSSGAPANCDVGHTLVCRSSPHPCVGIWKILAQTNGSSVHRLQFPALPGQGWIT